MARCHLLLAAAVLLPGLWMLGTRRAGQDWGDDFALYVSHARNLAEGRAYDDTGYLYNPAYPVYSPRTYPPVFPLLLAPVYRLAGLNLEIMKVEQVIFLVLMLAVVARRVRTELPPAYAAGLVFLLGLSPFLWLYKDRIMSEVPYLLFSMLALHLLDGERERPLVRRLARAVLAGLVIYLACGTRAVGIVLLPCAVLTDIVADGVRRWRWPGLMSLAVLTTFGLCVLAQRQMLVLEGSYLDQWTFDPATPFRNLVALARGADEVLGSPTQRLVRLLVLMPLGAVVVFGYVRCLWRRPGAREFYLPLYLLLLLLWPVGGFTPRFLLPLLPVVLTYLAQGVHGLAERLGERRGRIAAGGIAAAVLLAYIGLYSRLDFGPLRHGIGHPQAQTLFDFVRTQTPPEAVIVFSKARALALFTGRQATPAQAPAEDAALWAHLHAVGATHFIVGRPFPDTDTFLQAFAERYPTRMREVYRNEHFRVYRIGESTE